MKRFITILVTSNMDKEVESIEELAQKYRKQKFKEAFRVRKLANKKRVKRKSRRLLVEDSVLWEEQLESEDVEEDVIVAKNRKNTFLAAIKENYGQQFGMRTKIIFNNHHKIDNWNTLKTRLVSSRMRVSLNILLRKRGDNVSSLH